MNQNDYMMKLRNKIVNHGQEFKKIFNVPINQFIDFTGFDIIKFDEYLKTPDGISTAEFIEKKYGKDAIELIKNIL